MSTVSRKTGKEKLHRSGTELPYDILGFWQWSNSNLLGNTLRGFLAEYLVACDLGMTDGVAESWQAYDLITKDGLKIEVKSSAYLQNWHQEKFSKIIFGIAPKRAWDADTNKLGNVKKRNADVYVFCVLKHKDKKTVDPLDLDQWDFYVLSTHVLNKIVGDQKTISLSKLEKLQPQKVRFGEIRSVIEKMRLHENS